MPSLAPYTPAADYISLNVLRDATGTVIQGSVAVSGLKGIDDLLDVLRTLMPLLQDAAPCPTS